MLVVYDSYLEGDGVCERKLSEALVASVGCCSVGGLSAGTSTRFCDLERVPTPPRQMEEEKFMLDLGAGFQELPEEVIHGSCSVTRSRPWRWTEEVHIGEARFLVEALRLLAAAEAGQSLRGDSVAVCLAFERRRAASFRLLRLVRCFAAICSPSRHHHGEFHRTSCATCVAALPVPFQ